jgi:flagellar hook-associated protein FlgK
MDPTRPENDIFKGDSGGILADAKKEFRRRVRAQAVDKVVSLMQNLADATRAVTTRQHEADSECRKQIKEINKRAKELQRLGIKIGMGVDDTSAGNDDSGDTDDA